TVVGPAGGATISYILPTGCASFDFMNITMPPGPITGPDHVCELNAIMLSDPISGGIWSSSASTASVAAGSPATNGVVTGLVAGAATISYTAPGCPSVTHNVTIDPLPAVITGSPAIC